MDSTSFSPQVKAAPDRISQGLSKVARYILVGLLGLLPLLFIPGLPGFMAGSKAFFVVFALVVVVILASLAMLRSGVVPLRLSPVILAWWGVVAASAVAALLAPQLQVAFLGQTIEVHTVAFLGIMGVLMTAVSLFKGGEKMVVYLYLLLLGSAFVLALMHLLRAIVGETFLTLGVLTGSATSLIGTFNDLALYMVLAVIIALIALVQLRLPQSIAIVFAVCVAMALGVLAIVSFSASWLVLSLFSLLLLMYTLTRDRFGDAKVAVGEGPSLAATLVTVMVFVVSTVFLIGGGSLASSIANATGISFIEVRPSTEATLTILRNVYGDNALTGAGPNHFVEAWTMYKDRQLNETLFWSTTFGAGSGYVPTWFVTTGLLGVLAWLIFIGMFLYTGAQALLRSRVNEPFWYFVATVTFVSGLYVWAMAFWYVPGPTILFLGAMSTGLLVVAHHVLVPKQYPTVNLLTTARTGFVLITIVMLVIIGSILAGYQATQQLMAATTYLDTASGNRGTDQNTVTAGLVSAFQQYPTDAYARDIALYQLGVINTLLTTAEVNQATQEQFQATLLAAIEASDEAVRLRPTDARNWRVQGDIYAALTAVNIDGAPARALEAYEQAEALDPQNPYYALQRAFIATQAGNAEEARSQAERALALKNNYTDALFFLTQLDIASNNLEQAITRTRSLISLEQNNPGRYYQLGVLLSAADDRRGAVDAFSAALTLNPDYANARYLRALEFFEAGERDVALAELRIVQTANPDNADLNTLIGQIERNEVTPETINRQPIPETTEVSQGDAVSTDGTAPDTDLITPINTVSEEGESTETTETVEAVTDTEPVPQAGE